MNTTRWLLLAATAITPAVVPAQSVHPKEPLTLVEIVAHLEEAGYAPIIEISFDDGAWEVEAYRGEASKELTVDPETAEVLSEHRDDAEPRPPKGSMPLSMLLKELSEAGHAQIEEVSFERRYWEVEIRRGREKRELHVDPKTAKVVSDRIDD